MWPFPRWGIPDAAMQQLQGGLIASAIVNFVGANILGSETTYPSDEGKGTDMTNRLIAEARKYAAYRRTLRELGALPLDTRLDLDIDSGNMRRIAQRAVYGA